MPILFSSRDARLYIYISVPFSCIFFQASHRPSGHMIRSRPLIGRSPLPPQKKQIWFFLIKITQLLFFFLFFLFLFFYEATSKKKEINHSTSPKLYWSYYAHRSRDSLYPLCGIFKILFYMIFFPLGPLTLNTTKNIHLNWGVPKCGVLFTSLVTEKLGDSHKPAS